MLRYTYIVTERNPYMDDDGFTSYTNEYISDQVLKVFDSKELAFEAANEAADEEIDTLNSDLTEDDEMSFGISEGDDGYQNGSEIIVNCYFDDSETQLVTRRVILPVEV